MLRNGDRDGQTKQRKAEARQEHDTLAEKAARGVKKTEAIASKRKAREHYLAWKEDADAMRAERVDYDKKAWQARMGIIDESDVPTKEKPVYPVKQDEAAEQRQTELAQLLRTADKTHLASATEQQAKAEATEETERAAKEERLAREKAAADAAEADKAFFSSDERKASLQRMENAREARELLAEDKALAAEQAVIEAEQARRDSKTLRGRMRTIKNAISDKTNLVIGGAFLAVGNRLRNAEEYQESENKRRGAIALGVGTIAVAAISYAAYKGFSELSEAANLPDPSDALSNGDGGFIEPSHEIVEPGAEAGGDVSSDAGTPEAEGDSTPEQEPDAGDEGSNPEAGDDQSPEQSGDAGTPEAEGDSTPEQSDDDMTSDVEESLTTEELAQQTEVLAVDSKAGFISTISEQYGLSSDQADQAYEAIKQHLAGAEGTYTEGTDIRISNPGTFE
ncbi:MAG: hypothetical protein LC687_07475, partial [Actinobacteria bacterium]|nr:hypothetical protein [Actinomycetota bacterium]